MALSQVVSNNPHALMTNLNTNPSYESSSANISDGIYVHTNSKLFTCFKMHIALFQTAIATRTLSHSLLTARYACMASFLASPPPRYFFIFNCM